MERTKICKKCNIEKPISDFPKEKRNKDGYRNECRECRNAYRNMLNKKNREYELEYKRNYHKENKEKEKEYYEKVDKERKKRRYYENRDEILEKRKKYYEENEGKIKEYRKGYWKKRYYANIEYEKERKKRYYLENKEKFSVWTGNRRAMEDALPHSLTTKNWETILEECGYTCIISGTGNISLEHFIPLCTGHGGTIIENVYPMDLHLNISKNGSNPFEWIKNQEVYIQHNFYHILVPYIANKNNLTVMELKEYTYWCFNNKRTIEQVKIDNEKGLSSIDLWRMSN